MTDKKSRRDPYKNFNFRVAVVGALVALAGWAITRKTSPAKTDRDEREGG